VGTAWAVNPQMQPKPTMLDAARPHAADRGHCFPKARGGSAGRLATSLRRRRGWRGGPPKAACDQHQAPTRAVPYREKPQHTAGHRDGDPVDGQLADQRVDHLGDWLSRRFACDR
jgi:hypothetical protein